MTLHADAERVLKAWAAPDGQQEELRLGFLDHLAAHEDGMWKACRAGHITASVLVLTESPRGTSPSDALTARPGPPPGSSSRLLPRAAPSERRPQEGARGRIPASPKGGGEGETGGKVLLTLHRKLGIWLQMGGHCEPGDVSLAAAALREGTEESGIAGLTLLPGGPVRLDRHPTPCAWHFDVQYAALAPAGAVEVISDESLDLRWYAHDEVPGVADTSVVQLVAAAWAALRQAR